MNKESCQQKSQIALAVYNVWITLWKSYYYTTKGAILLDSIIKRSRFSTNKSEC